MINGFNDTIYGMLIQYTKMLLESSRFQSLRYKGIIPTDIVNDAIINNPNECERIILQKDIKNRLFTELKTYTPERLTEYSHKKNVKKLIETTQVCNKCNEIKAMNQFSRIITSANSIFTYKTCNKCNYKKSNEWVSKKMKEDIAFAMEYRRKKRLYCPKHRRYNPNSLVNYLMKIMPLTLIIPTR